MNMMPIADNLVACYLLLLHFIQSTRLPFFIEILEAHFFHVTIDQRHLFSGLFSQLVEFAFYVILIGCELTLVVDFFLTSHDNRRHHGVVSVAELAVLAFSPFHFAPQPVERAQQRFLFHRRVQNFTHGSHACGHLLVAVFTLGLHRISRQLLFDVRLGPGDEIVVLEFRHQLAHVILQHLRSTEHALPRGTEPEQQGHLFLGQGVAQLLRAVFERDLSRVMEVGQQLVGHPVQELAFVARERRHVRNELL